MLSCAAALSQKAKQKKERPAETGRTAQVAQTSRRPRSAAAQTSATAAAQVAQPTIPTAAAAPSLRPAPRRALAAAAGQRAKTAEKPAVAAERAERYSSEKRFEKPLPTPVLRNRELLKRNDGAYSTPAVSSPTAQLGGLVASCRRQRRIPVLAARDGLPASVSPTSA